MQNYPKTFIIEYIAGCKGDFLTNWLNYNKVNFNSDIPSKSEILTPVKLSLPDNNIEPYIDNSLNYLPPIDQLIQKLEIAKNFKFINAHTMSYYRLPIYKNEFIKRNIDIKKIIFEEKYSITIFIENFFKNLECGNLKYINDYFEKNNFNTNNKKIDFIYTYLSQFKKYNKNTLLYNFHKGQNKNKNLLNYEDLYVKFNISDLDILENLNINEYIKEIENTWLPDKITKFNHTFDLIKMGYRNF